MKWFALFIAMLMLLTTVAGAVAVNETEDNETDVNGEDEPEEEAIEDLEEVEEEAGVTPDQPVLYGLERAMERISLALTLNKAAKAKKGLVHARERLQEVQLMIARKKLEQAEKAQQIHDKIMEQVEEDIEEFGDGEEQELEDSAEIENELLLYQQRLEKLARIRARLEKVKEHQINKIDMLVGKLNQTQERIRIAVENKQEKTYLKIKARTGMTDEEFEELREDIRDIYENASDETIEIRKQARQEIQEVIRERVREHRNITDEETES